MISIDQLRSVLRGHFLFAIKCDHENKTDTPWCGCSLVDLGTHPSVGEAVEAWISHVLDVLDTLGEVGEP